MPAANEAGNPKTQAPIPKQISSSKLSNQLRSARLGLGRLKFVWNLGFWLSSFCRFLNNLPTLAQMFFCGEHIAEADPHYCSAAQFCLREIRAPGRVDSLYDIAV